MNDQHTKAVEWAATALSILGAVLNALGLKAGFVVWLAANALWIVFGLGFKRWGLVATFVVYTVCCVIGLVVW